MATGRTMLQYSLREALRLALALLGGVLLAAAISALADENAYKGAWPFLVTMGTRLPSLFQFDFGASILSGSAAGEEFAARLPVTLSLVASGFVIAIVIGLPIGLVLGAGPLRRAAAPLLQIIAAAPVFCGGLILAYAAHHFFGWEPSAGGQTASWAALLRGEPAAWGHLFLPALTVGAAGIASVQLALRRAASHEADAPYRTYLRRMGLSAFEIERVYVLRPILAGLLRHAGEIMLALLAAAAVAEWVFDYPGAAVLFVKSVALGDWNMAALIIFIFAALAMLADFAGRLLAYLVAETEVA